MPITRRSIRTRLTEVLLRVLAACLLLTTIFYFNEQPPTANAQSFTYVPGELIVGLKDGVNSENFSLIEPLDFALTPKPLVESLNAYIVEVPEGEEEVYRKRLLQSDDVLFVDYNYYITIADTPLVPNDPQWASQYGPRAVRADYAWNITTGSPSVVIAVIDTGIDRSHPEFSGRLTAGYDFVQGDSIPQDEHSHGTHVAGIAAATGNNAIGVAGVDWRAKIMAVRVLDAHGDGTLANAAAGIIWAADHGADVINLSISGPSFPSPTILEDATYYAYRKGVVLVAAAGNYASNPVTYPARYPWVIAVGMTDSVNSRRVESNYGNDLDLMAPGYNILSTMPGGGYGYKSGTSMSAPFVAGAAALLRTDGKFNSPQKIYEALTQTALDLGAPGKDIYNGYGLLQLDSALSYTPVSEPPVEPVPDVVYELRDSAECTNIPFNWVDIPRTTQNFLGIFGNDTIATVTLPFPFRYAGNEYSKIRVTDNGFISFDLSTSLYDAQRMNGPLPGIGTPQQILAPFWDDLNPSADPEAGIYALTLGTAPARRYVITWHHMPLQAIPTSFVTFQLILYEESGVIDFQYLTASGPFSTGGSASIGLEYGNGLFGLQVGFNKEGAISNKRALKFYPVEEGIPSDVPGCIKATELPPAPEQNTGQGGERTLESLPFRVYLPEGALSPGATLRLRTFTEFTGGSSGMTDLRQYAQLIPDPAQFGWLEPKPRLCYFYTSADVLSAGGHAENLLLAVFDHSTGAWSALSTTLEKSMGAVCAYIPYYSVYGVFGRELPRKLPVTGADLGD